MTETGKNKRSLIVSVFLPGLLIGALIFIATYGVKVLVVTNDSWINRVQDPDIHQHYLGWCHFRNCPWFSPPGLMDTLSWPHKMSILWTDSIPLLALIFKCFRTVLPETFQYFGIYGLLSFALTGGTAALLIYRLTSDRAASYAGAFILTESFPMLQRMFYHTSLTAHYLIIIPLLFWLYEGRKWSVRKKCLIWGLYFLLTVMIHPYLWAMGAVIALFAFIDEILITKDIRPAVITGLLSCILTYGALFLMGAFYGNIETSYKGGGFESNLNTFINPLNYSRIFPALPLNAPNQYEGFAYLGLGGMILLISAAVSFFIIMKRSGKEALSPGRRKILMLLMGMLFFFLAVTPDISLNSKLLFTLRLPGPLEDIQGIFRSGGRFIWPVLILIYAVSFKLLYSLKKKLIPVILSVLIILLQLFDMSGVLIKKYERFTKDSGPWHSDLENEALMPLIKNYKHIVLVTTDQYITDRTAYFAVKNSLTLNRFYFARNIDDRIAETLEEYHEECRKGNTPSDVIFVFDADSLEEWKKDTDLNFYDLTGTVIGIKDTIDAPGASDS